MSNSLKQKAVNGVLWSCIDRFASQGITFATGIIMARLLMPKDYGIIAMISFFLSIAQTFVDSGFSTALIRKTDRTETDCSTIFYFNIITSLFFYSTLFFAAPLIASFYKIPSLTSIIRVIGITLIVNSFAIIQQTILTANIDFKTQTITSIISWSIPGIVGIYFAYIGFGVWALVIQSISTAFLRTICLWIFIKWRPILVFSKQSFNELFSFGSKLLGVAILNTSYENLNMLVIGKVFSASSLGLYSRAQQFVGYTTWNLEGILQRVTYPILCSIQNDENRLSINYSRMIKLAAFIIFPLTMGLAAIASPMIRLILTNKWSGTIVLLQILCFSGIWYPIHAINLNFLQVRGLSNVILKIEILKKTIGIILLTISIPFGLVWFCISCVASSLISLLINFFYISRHTNFKFSRQIKDLLPAFIQSLIMFIIVILIIPLLTSYITQLFIGIFIGSIAYIFMAYITKSEELKILINIILKK
jgi:teichuronic acid exporter